MHHILLWLNGFMSASFSILQIQSCKDEIYKSPSYPCAWAKTDQAKFNYCCYAGLFLHSVHRHSLQWIVADLPLHIFFKQWVFDFRQRKQKWALFISADFTSWNELYSFYMLLIATYCIYHAERLKLMIHLEDRRNCVLVLQCRNSSSIIRKIWLTQHVSF